MINYSFIIPHKNIPELLKRCLNSIPRREDIQIIVVDDNSDPSIVDFEHFPGVNDPCVDVVRVKENRGAGHARNVGIRHAVGKWCCFVDADDFLCPGSLGNLDVYKDLTVDVVVFKVESRDSETMEINEKRSKGINKLIEASINGILSPDKLLAMYPTPWGKLVQRAFLKDNSIYFQETFIADDVLWSKKLAAFANRILVSGTVLCCVVMRTGSLTSHITKSKLLQCYGVDKYTAKYLRSIDAQKYESTIIGCLRLFSSFGFKAYIAFLIMAYRDRMLFAGAELHRNYCKALGHRRWPVCLHIVAYFLLIFRRKWNSFFHYKE